MLKKILVTLVVLMITIPFSGLVSASGSGSTNWLSGWTYRKAHIINGSSAGAQTNYPVEFDVHYSFGFDVGSDVYLDYNCRTDFGDIRFTDASGVNVLSDYIEQDQNGVQALLWVSIPYIPQSPNNATIYIYYGNPSATTTSNRNLVFPLASDFEDGTNQGWTITWTGAPSDGVSTTAFQGNYSRYASRIYGFEFSSGTGNFFDGFQTSVYLSAGTYLLTCAAAFSVEDSYETPIGITAIVNGINVSYVSNPGTIWQLLDGNFTVRTSGTFEVFVEFHLLVTSVCVVDTEGYFLDSVILREWCNPEPTNGNWGPEQTTSGPLPEINSIAWAPTCPAPLVPSAVPRQGEPVLVEVNVSNEAGVSGALVEISFRVNSGAWWNCSMTLNTTTGLWTATIPGQPGNSTVEFLIQAYNNAGNTISSTYTYDVKALIPGDINGDGVVNGKDLHIFAQNWLSGG